MSEIKHNLQANFSDLTKEEVEVALRALGYYQVHLFDEINKKKSAGENTGVLETESQTATTAIKKIHKKIEHKSAAKL